ncbi:MAG: hypothetical protein P3M75_00245 [Candidatus Hodgkinia cicadicola]|nr:MAG: hypothetical protein P3M75_00245 [Candidatus Hodgkinia cicadicola]
MLAASPRTYLLHNTTPIELIIGLESHVQFSSGYKLFSGSAGAAFVLDVGIPGSLPSVNLFDVVGFGALASVLNCKLATWLSFTRKEYFCVDLALGYQITQQQNPLMAWGKIAVHMFNINGTVCVRTAHVRSVNLEHDAGCVIGFPSLKTVDFKRSGTSLLEIISFPCFDSIGFVKLYLLKLKLVLSSLGLSSCAMADARMRFDFNFSMNEPLADYSARTEVKNLNSVSSLNAVLLTEVSRLRCSRIASTKTVNFKTLTTLFLRRKQREYSRLFEPNVPPVRVSSSVQAFVQALNLGFGLCWFSSFGLVSSFALSFSDFSSHLELVFSSFGFKLLGWTLKRELCKTVSLIA